jgi:hypothetical protein
MMTLFLSLALAATATETPPADAAPVTQPAKPAKPKKICRSTVMTGSNIGRRVCKTQDQWNTEDSAKLDILNQGNKGQQGGGSLGK